MRELSLWSGLLDASIFWSFDRSGYLRHAREFVGEDLEVDLAGRRIAVTGANSGIGKATAAALAERGAEVLMLCRSRERGEAALEELVVRTGSTKLALHQVDLSDLTSVESVAEELSGQPLHGLVHNAGVLPSARQVSPQGHELTVATHLLGPFLLTWRLLPSLRAAESARLLFVTSGGMYTQKLSLRDFQHEEPPYDGVAAYARTKRAQVVLTGMLAERLAGSAVITHAMHPGWADTPAVTSSLPGFHRVMKGRLRSPEQGADTLVWLAAAAEPLQQAGKLWFDRRVVSPYYLPRTREKAETRTALWESLCRLCGLSPDAPLP